MTTENDGKTVVPPGASSAETQNTGGQAEEKTVPYERFREVNVKLKELSKWREDQEAAQTAAAAQAKADQEKQLAEQAQWQTLAEQRAAELATAATERDALRQRTASYETALKAILETQRKGLPQHLLTLLDRLDPAEQLQYLASNAAELSKGNNGPGTPATQKRNTPPTTPEAGRKPFTL